MLREYAFLDPHPKFTILADRRKFPPRGLFGGKDGRTARYTLVSKDGTEEALGSKTTFFVPEGAIVRYETCGGGGYGDPLTRDPKLVLRDVKEGKISVARAEAAYGVAIDAGQLVIDERRTQAMRQRTGAS